MKLKLLVRYTDSLKFMEQGLRGAISRVKKDEYHKAMAVAHNLTILRVLEHRVRTDARLMEDDREQLLNDLGTAMYRLACLSLPTQRVST